MFCAAPFDRLLKKKLFNLQVFGFLLS